MAAARRSSVILLLATLCLGLPLQASRAAIHNIDQISTSFQPADITIQVGDMVVWNHTSGSHTVTNGTGAADPNAGTMFDAPLNSSNTTFQYTFNTAGTVPYFCRPHEGFGMKGTITVEATADVPRGSGAHNALLQASPNPFRNTTRISYSIAQPERVRLLVFDATGRLARTLVNEFVSSPGVHRVEWDGAGDGGRQLPAGVYFYSLRAGEFRAMHRMILVK